MDASKKKRAANLQNAEKELLVDLVTKFRNVIECKATDVTSVKTRNDAWTTLAAEFNGVTTSGVIRDWQQLKHVCTTSPVLQV